MSILTAPWLATPLAGRGVCCGSGVGGGSRRGLPRHWGSVCWEGRTEQKAGPLQLRWLQQRLEPWGGGSPRSGPGAAQESSRRPEGRPLERRWLLWRGNGDLGWTEPARGGHWARPSPARSLCGAGGRRIWRFGSRGSGGAELLEERSGSRGVLTLRPEAQSQARR